MSHLIVLMFEYARSFNLVHIQTSVSTFNKKNKKITHRKADDALILTDLSQSQLHTYCITSIVVQSFRVITSYRQALLMLTILSTHTLQLYKTLTCFTAHWLRSNTKTLPRPCKTMVSRSQYMAHALVYKGCWTTKEKESVKKAKPSASQREPRYDLNSTSTDGTRKEAIVS